VPLISVRLGPLLNGFVNYEYWVPVAKMHFPGLAEMLTKYQAKAIEKKVDALGYYFFPLAYAQMQVVQQAVRKTESLDDANLSDFCRTSTFETVIGSIGFGEGGEWPEPRIVQVQFQNIENNQIQTFKDGRVQVMVEPIEYAFGSLQYLFAS
jgi:branched-chain amino acid transport system substrate-binding protein